jgi:hypothetical protein
MNKPRQGHTASKSRCGEGLQHLCRVHRNYALASVVEVKRGCAEHRNPSPTSQLIASIDCNRKGVCYPSRVY